MTIIQRIAALNLPSDQMVVIGSGLLDALSLRQSSDIDLVVSDELFTSLKNLGKYTIVLRRNQEVLERGDVEIWRDWGPEEEMSFQALYTTGVEIEGIRFCHPQVVLGWKRQKQRDKDVEDIVLLEGYLKSHPTIFS